MLITVVRNIFSDIATMSDFYIDGKWFCANLEDFDRDLLQTDPLDRIKTVKVAGQTCIPRGIYEVKITLSARFKRLMPQIMDVPGFEGIRIHSGNTDKDTEGCLLLGKTRSYNLVTESKKAFDEFFPVLKQRLDHERCQIEILKLDLTKKILK